MYPLIWIHGLQTLPSQCLHFSLDFILQVLNGLTLTINEGETVALVGPSGSGKSTVIQLIQRFYDADSGSVLVGGTDIKNLNLGKLRDRRVFRCEKHPPWSFHY